VPFGRALSWWQRIPKRTSASPQKGFGMSHIMVYGNPSDGFRFVGPFETEGQARRYCAGEPDNAWVAELDTPADMGIERKSWDISITKTANGFKYTMTGLGEGLASHRDVLAATIKRMIDTYLPSMETIEEPKPTAVEGYAAWLARQPKPKNFAEALDLVPPGVTGVMMDPDKPEVVHNAIAEAVGERPSPAEDLARRYDGGEHPVWSAADWRQDVNASDTRLGYWEWVLHQIESFEDPSDDIAKEMLPI
jgi:hypothetical protein